MMGSIEQTTLFEFEALVNAILDENGHDPMDISEIQEYFDGGYSAEEAAQEIMESFEFK